jgi:hypothetical protein
MKRFYKDVKTPGVGFVYLVFLLAGLGLFVWWGFSEQWYERINTPRQTESDLEQWDAYKSRIQKFKDNLKSMTRSYEKKEKLMTALEKDPTNLSLQGEMIRFKYNSGEAGEAIRLALEMIGKKTKSIPYAVYKVLFAEMRKLKSVDLYETLISHISSYETKKVPLADNACTLGLGWSWTLMDGINAVIIENPNIFPVIPTLKLSCKEKSQWPLTIKIYALQQDFQGKINGLKPIQIELPVIPAKERMLISIETDKWFKVNVNDFGVKVEQVILTKVEN